MTLQAFSLQQIEDFKDYLRKHPTISNGKASTALGISRTYIALLKKQVKDEDVTYEEEKDANDIKKAMNLQRLRDHQRLERKEFRNASRAYMEQESLYSELIDMIADRPEKANTQHETTEGGTLLIQLSDLHSGEVVNLPNNKFNYQIMAARLCKYVRQAVEAGRRYGCTKAVFALTGDLANSNRRPSEALTNSYNRAHATMFIYDVVDQFLDYVSNVMKVSAVVSVCGNESRIDKDFAFVDKMLTDNLDYLVHEMLRASNRHIKFSDWSSPVERILNVENKRILMSHGITMAKATPSKQVAYYQEKYGPIDLMITGHLHEPLVAPRYSRSGSVVGANDFSEFGLGIATSVPSQTFHIVSSTGIISAPVDLSASSADDLFVTIRDTPAPVTDTSIEINL